MDTSSDTVESSTQDLLEMLTAALANYGPVKASVAADAILSLYVSLLAEASLDASINPTVQIENFREAIDYSIDSLKAFKRNGLTTLITPAAH